MGPRIASFLRGLLTSHLGITIHSQSPVDVHLVSEAVLWMSSGNNAPPEFSFLEELFPREVYHTTYHTDMSVKDTMVRHSLLLATVLACL